MNKIRIKTSLFFNYLVHGIGLIIITQNLESLAHNWHSSLAVASFVLSGLGIGRLIAYLIMGFISDHFGRKLTLSIGMITYLLFFIVTPFNQSVLVAYGLSIIAGIANSALDSSTYPLMADLNGTNSSSSVLIKAFMSAGEFILPIIVLTLKEQHLWFGFSFVLPTLILVINLINILTTRFPKSSQNNINENHQQMNIASWKKILLTGSLLIYGFASMAVMIWFTQWISIFATHIGFNNVVAHLLLSLYSIGSISGVIVVFLLLKQFNIQKSIFLILNLVSLISISIIALNQNPILSYLAAFSFGFSAAGGLMQIALNTLLSIYPKHKGLLTAWFMIFGSIASFTVPLITGIIIRSPKFNIMAGDIVVAMIGLMVAIIVFYLLPNTNSLTEARQEIDKIDTKLVRLLEQRFKNVNIISDFKKRNHLAVTDSNREKQVLNLTTQNTNDAKLIPFNKAIMQNIMDNTKEFENQIK